MTLSPDELTAVIEDATELRKDAKVRADMWREMADERPFALCLDEKAKTVDLMHFRAVRLERALKQLRAEVPA